MARRCIATTDLTVCMAGKLVQPCPTINIIVSPPTARPLDQTSKAHPNQTLPKTSLSPAASKSL